MKQRGLYIFLALICALSLVAITYGLVLISLMSIFETTLSLYELVLGILQIGTLIFIAFFLPLLFVILVRWGLQRFRFIAFFISCLLMAGYGYIFLNDLVSVYSEEGRRLWFVIFINTITLLLIGEFFIWKFHDGKVTYYHLKKMDYLKVLLICIWVVYQGIFVQEGFVTQEELTITHVPLVLLPFIPFVFLLSLNIFTSLNLNDKERMTRGNILMISIGMVFFLSILELGGLRYLDGKFLFLIWIIISMICCLQLLIMVFVLDKFAEYRIYFFSVLYSFAFISLILVFKYTENISDALMLFIKSFADFMLYLILMIYISHLYQGKRLERILLDILLGIGYFAFIRNLSDFNSISSFDSVEFLFLLVSFSLLRESFVFLSSRYLTASR